ncbi:terpene synthase family metal binding domain-containing protein [Penicillium canariense]|uniref:Terpene synthase n=1 Tax=Penicillium canariense TaxID=189055 RepID=A0A9W9HNA3_9EURO|nr:terpene synthase family metal binding domain-containing protein [Penicillium canariense]KAJ5151407.1 terpene synthase family metal binding domain-containing protein [Penicillium canariense]
MGSIHDTLELSSQLSGKTLRIPNLQAIFQHWPSAINTRLACLRREIDVLLEKTIDDERKLNALKFCDFALLTCCISLYPQAKWEELRTAGIFMLWIFLWDDEIDDGGTLIAHSESAANSYCQDSLEYARLALGLNTTDESVFQNQDFQNMQCPVSTMLYFRDACEVLRTVMDSGQRNRLFRELQSYMIWTTKEQVARESGQILKPDQHLELRNWTSGIYPVIAIFEFITQGKLDESLIESEDMKVIWTETCFLCMLINDIHSAKKELTSGSMLNVVPILFHADQGNNLDDVMEILVGKLTLDISIFVVPLLHGY